MPLDSASREAAKGLSRYLDDSRLPFFLWLRRVTADRLYEVHREHLGAKVRDIRREESGPQPPRRKLKEMASPSDLAVEAERRSTLVDALEKHLFSRIRG